MTLNNHFVAGHEFSGNRNSVAETRYRIAETQSKGALVKDRLEFDIVCPNTHNKAVTFSQEEFEETLESGALVFLCNTCNTTWSLSQEEIAKIRKQFAKMST